MTPGKIGAVSVYRGQRSEGGFKKEAVVMAQSKEKHKAKHQAIAAMFAAVEGERFPFVVNRDGNARQRDIIVNGNIILSWTSSGNSVPIDLPAGTYDLQGIIIGNSGDSWAFAVVSPVDQPLQSGNLTDLGVDSFPAQVTIP
jgi:hypothetical protein